MLRPATWPCPANGNEYALIADSSRSIRLLVLPALFDEANKLRHFSAEVMRLLDEAGLDCFAPDLAGCNESTASLGAQSLSMWREQASAATRHFSATHILALRGGALIDPGQLRALHYAPIIGEKLLRAMLRAETIRLKEAGQEIDRNTLLQRALENGCELCGHQLGAQMIRELQDAAPSQAQSETIAQADIGGGGLWLRAEPGHDEAQAKALAQLVMAKLT